MEVEKRLSKDEYLTLLMSADTSKRQIRKDRYCLTYDNQYFELDVYPFWDDKAILEIEQSKKQQLPADDPLTAVFGMDIYG